jgi:mutator protein MutT
MTATVVTAAVIERDGCLFVTKRQSGVHLAGYWEFPGGKCEANETPAGCLARELREELDVDVRIGEELFTTTHAYPDRVVEIHFLRCELFGDPVPQFGQEMRWVTRAELTTLQFPPADTAFIRQLAPLA